MDDVKIKSNDSFEKWKADKKAAGLWKGSDELDKQYSSKKPMAMKPGYSK